MGSGPIRRTVRYAARFDTPQGPIRREIRYAARFDTPQDSVCREIRYAARSDTPRDSIRRKIRYAARFDTPRDSIRRKVRYDQIHAAIRILGQCVNRLFQEFFYFFGRIFWESVLIVSSFWSIAAPSSANLVSTAASANRSLSFW